jgi:1-phosphofructokinase family hexose kinase
MSRVVTVALNPSLDKTVCVGRLDVGHELRADRLQTVAGGKAVNVVRMLRTLKVKAEIIGIAAGLGGLQFQELLQGEGIPQEWVLTEGEARVNLTVREERTGRVTRFLEPGPTVRPVDQGTFQELFARRLSRANVVVLSGSLPPGCSSAIYARMIRQAKQANVLTVLDTNGAALASGIKAGPFMIKPNRDEAEALCGFRISGRSGVKKALQYLGRRSNIVLLSLGSDGLAGMDGARMFLARGPVVKSHATVGCGDVALAGFLAGFLKGETFEDCLKLAAACGAANVSAALPGKLALGRVRVFQHKIKVERL